MAFSPNNTIAGHFFGGSPGGYQPPAPPEPPGLNTPLSENAFNQFFEQVRPERSYLGPVKWLGESLSKLGRPVRQGVSDLTRFLGGGDLPHAGNNSEYLAALPFSDTLGDLTEHYFGTRVGTDPKHAVTGHDLFRQWGLSDEKQQPLFNPFDEGSTVYKPWTWGHNFSSPQAWGELGTDLVTDPLTYATFLGSGVLKGLLPAAAARSATPTVTGLGRAAQVGSRIPLVGQRLFGSAARTAELAALEQAGKAPLLELGTATGNLAKSPLTAAGKLLAQKDLLPTGTAQRLAGFGSLEELPQEIMNLAASPATSAADQALLNEIIRGAQAGKAVPLSGVARFNAPFTGGRVGLTVGTSPLTRPLAQAATFPFGGLPLGTYGQDLLSRTANQVPGMTRFRELFSREKGGNQPTALGQQMYQKSLAPLERQAGQEFGEAVPGALQEMAGAGGRALHTNEPAAVKYLNDLMEGLPAAAPPALDPTAQAAAGQAAGALHQSMDAGLAELQRLGYDVNAIPQRQFPGDPMRYSPRFGEPSLKPGTATPRAPSPAAQAGQFHRELDASKNVLNEIYNDPYLAGLSRGAVSDQDAVNYLVGKYGSPELLQGPTPTGAPLGRAGGVRSLADAENFVQWAKSRDPQAAKDAAEFFSHNPLADVALHNLGLAKQAAKARAAHQELALAAVHEGELQKALAAGQQVGATETLPHALGALGLPGGQQHLADQLGGLLGRPVAPSELGQFRVRKEVLDALAGLMGPVKPGRVENFLSAIPGWDTLTNLFKAYQTVPFPAHHAQNALGGIFQNWVTSAFSPAAYAKAVQFLRGKAVKGLAQTSEYARYGTDEAATQAMMRQLAGTGLLQRSGHHVGDLTLGTKAQQAVDSSLAYPGVASVKEQFLGGEPLLSAAAANPLKARGVGGATQSEFLPLRAGEGALEYADKVNRLAHYLARVEQGSSHLGATASTLKAHLDYRQLTEFERNTMRRIFPFYSFSRLNLPTQARQVMEAPGRPNLTLQATARAQDEADQGGGYLPEFLRTSFALPAGPVQPSKDPVSGRPRANQAFMQLPSLPMEDALRWLQSVGGPESLQRTAYGVASQLNPMIKAPLEMLTGKDLYSRGDQEFAGDARWYEDPAMKRLQQAGRYLPGGRLVHQMARIEKGFGPDSILSPFQVLAGELGLPFSFKQVEGNKARLRDAENVMQELVEKNVPGVRVKGSDTYVPGEEQKKAFLNQALLKEGKPLAFPQENQQLDPVTLMRMLASMKERDQLYSLYNKVENQEKSKAELADLLARQGQRPLLGDEARRLFELQEAARFRPEWEMLLRQAEQKIASRPDSGQHVKLPGAAGVKRMVGVLKRQTREVQP